MVSYKNHNFFKKDGKKASVRSKQQYLIWCVLVNPEACSWAKETKIASKLLKEFPDLKFWGSISNFLDFKPDSLAFCLSPMGNTLVRESYPIFQKMQNVKLVHKREAKLNSPKIGKDIEVKTKPKNLLDFIRSSKHG